MSATGSGKTITAASSALECLPGGRILVMVPTLDLCWSDRPGVAPLVGHGSPLVVAVCSLETAEALERLVVRTTTNPIQLALRAGKGPVIVSATYASLVDREDPEGPRWAKGAFAGRWRPLGQAGNWNGSTGSRWPRSTWPSWTRRTQQPVILAGPGSRSTTTSAFRRTSVSTSPAPPRILGAAVPQKGGRREVALAGSFTGYGMALLWDQRQPAGSRCGCLIAASGQLGAAC